MTPRRTFATALRVLTQLRRDHRTMALLIGVPSVLIALLRWVLDGRPESFQQIGPPLLALFPFITMFIVSSIAVLRERTSGTLERLLTTPMAKLDLLLGYSLAFSVVAIVQVAIATSLAVGVFGLEVRGGVALLALLAALDALLGMALGLLLSAFARSEFQAVQFLPAFVFPQLLLCGLVLPRPEMPRPLELLSNVLPLSYAIDGTNRVAHAGAGGHYLTVDIVVIAACLLVAITLGAATLRRRSA
ncbi:MAG: type transport system permease protein [Frankiaceae bacterium]|nr:type transport system permease protein [Frankiaceae bacterium]